MRIHIVNSFGNVYGGSERATLELYRELQTRVETLLWVDGDLDPCLADYPIRRVGEDGDRYPVGGTLLIAANIMRPGPWLERAGPERLILNCNTIVGPGLKYVLIDRLRNCGPLEIMYVSRFARNWVAIPGPVFPSPIDLLTFAPAARPPDGHFIVGRLSRDESYKHHPDDPALYRRLGAEGASLRIMGGRCLESVLGDDSCIALLSAGEIPAPDFLHGLDVFLYRTSAQWVEAGGRVVCEAMACGLPVVCHRHGGYAEWIVHGVDGLLFDGNAEAERMVLTLMADPTLRQRLGTAARTKMEHLFSPEARAAQLDFLCLPRRPIRSRKLLRRIDFAWELGGHSGHVTTLLPIARAMHARGHPVRFLLRDVDAGGDLAGVAEFTREPAPVWLGRVRNDKPCNFGEILANFGYADPILLRQLIEAWRARLEGAAAVVASVAPGAHIAARTLNIPSFEISQGFHIPPPTMPSPLLRDWESVPHVKLEAADHAVLGAINRVLMAYGVATLETIGDLFVGHSMLLTYPELDVYPGRGPSEYFGIPNSGEGAAVPAWPQGRGPKVFSYLYNYYPNLKMLLDSLEQLAMPTLMLCRGVDPALVAQHSDGTVRISQTPMAVSCLLAQCDLVVCHGSHQMTAQALLAGKPLLLLPSQLEQFMIARRVVRYGAGLGIAPGEADADFAGALTRLTSDPKYADQAQTFSQRYATHDRDAALATMIRRCEAAIAACQ